MAKAARVDFDSLDQQFAEAVRPSGGFSDEAVEHFRTFVREGKFQVDNRDLDADAFFWLDPLYDLTRSDLLGVRTRDGTWLQKPNPRYAEGIMLRKSSQGGATVFSILLQVWLCIDLRRGLNIGCFWPNEDDVIDFVQMRFVPLLESSEKMGFYIKPSNVSNTRSKQIGNSNLWFRYVNGKSKTDSVPMDIILGDEVRLWGEPGTVSGLMQRMDERFGQSEVRLKIWMSTVGSPGDAMENLWRDSNQVKYFTACPNHCLTEIRERPEDEADRLVPANERHSLRPGALVVDGVCMSDWGVHQITKMVDVEDAPPTAVYTCPCCGAAITDTRPGPGFVATFPKSGGMFGLEFARTLYRTIEPLKLRKTHDTARDKKQFWNGWMAKPYRDPKGTLIKEDHIRAARDDDKVEWWVNRPPGMTTYLGADFRTEEIHYVVLGVAGEDADNNVRGQVLHVGVIQGRGDDGADPFEALERLLYTYEIECAIIDYRPYTTTTLAMAGRNEHRLFLASYVQGEMVRRKKASASSRGMDEDVREKNIVLLDQTKSLKYALNSFAMGNWKMSPEALDQIGFYDRKRELHPAYDVAQEFCDHLTNIALAHIPRVTKNASGEAVGASAGFEEKFVDVNFDPHFTHAFNYAVMASYMQPSGMTLVGAKLPTASPTNPLGLKVPQPVHLTGKRCGTCKWWDGEDRGNALGRCERLGFLSGAMDPPCPYRLYRPRDGKD